RGGIMPHPRSVYRVDLRPDGQFLLAGEVSSRLWDARKGQPIGDLMIDEESAGFSADGRVFLTLGREGTVKLRDATTAAVLGKPLPFASRPNCAGFNNDGDSLAVGCEDGTVHVYDPATAQAVGPPRSMRRAVCRVAFTADGRSIAAIDEFGESRTWPFPEPIHDTSLDDLQLRIEARTGLRMEAGLSISRLDTPAGRESLEQLPRPAPPA